MRVWTLCIHHWPLMALRQSLLYITFIYRTGTTLDCVLEMTCLVGVINVKRVKVKEYMNLNKCLRFVTGNVNRSNTLVMHSIITFLNIVDDVQYFQRMRLMMFVKSHLNPMSEHTHFQHSVSVT